MTAQEIRRFLGFCTLLNYAILIVWFALFTLGHSFIYRLHTTWFPMSEEAYSQVN
ncbi:MAG: hypothetical protein UZ17_ACD001002714 [Acidobacteria bacterium OLB17]|nr:MAG: hypothetical protein UZ17_ACD001002714 [Acidobacteria bacterium OLB17]MCZ2390936.1 hypothetical protein [Acidobacteriota bacterium]